MYTTAFVSFGLCLPLHVRVLVYYMQLALYTHCQRVEETFTYGGAPWIWYCPPRLLYWLVSTAPMHLDHTLEGRKEVVVEDGVREGHIWSGGERSELQGRKEGRRGV